MPVGQTNVTFGRNVLANMGQTQLRNVYATVPTSFPLDPRKYGVLIIERVLSTGEFAAVDSKTLWVGGVGWVYEANHMVVASPNSFRLVFQSYDAGFLLKWGYF